MLLFHPCNGRALGLSQSRFPFDDLSCSPIGLSFTDYLQCVPKLAGYRCKGASTAADGACLQVAARELATAHTLATSYTLGHMLML